MQKARLRADPCPVGLHPGHPRVPATLIQPPARFLDRLPAPGGVDWTTPMRPTIRALVALTTVLALAVAFVDAFRMIPATQRPSWGSSVAVRRRELQLQRPLTARFAAPPPDGGYEGAVVPSQPEAALEEEGSADKRSLGDMFNLWKRRLWTKADFLHSHAVSGAAFMGLGSLYILHFLGDELFNHAALAKAEMGVVGWAPLAIMWTGVVNCISCLPMSKFRTGPTGGYDTKGAGFKGLGIGMTMLGIWTAYFFSGHYPAIVAPADPILALAFLAVIIHGIVNSEVALAKELQEKAPMMGEDGVWRGGGPGQAAETRVEIVLNHRVASYPNLLHLPVLYNIIAGGQAWAHTVAERFPLEPTLLFHAQLGIAVANSIVFLGATLKDRRLMTLRQWLLLQVVVLIPFVTTVVDIASLGSGVSIDPFQVYAGLMS